ncbi:MAG: polymerase subunit alpha, partial [Belnapia sp.]|nr:polymerase subunit alpha [Belnapia sp.]
AGEPWEPPHPAITHILSETYGIMVYQEQVMQIAQDMAGYSLGAADLLRRAMGKKIRSEMAAQREIFAKGATERGVDAAKAGEVFDLMEKFADYGFNKSHAAAYALVSYQTAWLKANHTVAFLAASMTLDLDKTDKLASHMQECSRIGIPVLPPDINRSGAVFLVEIMDDGTPAIRFALAAVKRVGATAMQALVAARNATGPFASVADFAHRVDPKLLNKMMVENLAKAGAFDRMEPNRAKLVTGAEVIMRAAQEAAERRADPTADMFGTGAFGNGAGPVPLRLKPMQDWPQLEKLGYEAEAVGFHLSAHPLDTYKDVLQRLDVTPFVAVADKARRGSATLRLAGTVVATKERPTRTGSRMCWVTLSDQTGSFEVTLFSEVLNRSRDLLSEGMAVVVTVEARVENDNLRLTANALEGLEKAAQNVGQGVRLWLEDLAAVEPIRALLDREGRGKGRVVVIARTGEGQEVEMALPGKFNVSPRMMQAMKVFPGVADVVPV